MDVLPRALAPSGSPVRTSEIAAWIHGLLAGRDRRDELIEAIAARFAVRHCFVFSSGRAAMALLLSALRELSQDPCRVEVVIPGYTCYSVASSIIKAGLTPRVCDIDAQTLSYDLDSLREVNFQRVLAIVSANLYGSPNELPLIERLAQEQDVYLLDDAAQSLNARVGERFVGTFGTAGMFSLDKGKNITAIQGGLVVTDRDDLARILRNQQSTMADPDLVESAKEYLKLLAYYSFLHPRFYWLPAGLPLLRLGETRYEEDYPLKLLSAGLSSIAHAQFARLESITSRRLEVASWYASEIPEGSRIQPIAPVGDARPVFLRFPLRILDADLRKEFLRECSNLGVTGSYPLPIARVPEITGRLVIHNGKYDNALAISREIVTLPTHAFVTSADVEKIIRILRTILRG